MDEMFYYLLFWVCLTGLCLGSFFNVVILRSLSGESIVFPPSKCPKCGNKLYFWHNIPVISYIFLKGKCYFCKQKISLQYPLVEMITMLLYGSAFLKFGISVVTLFVLFWISCLIIMTGTDIREKLVDCNIAILMGVSGIIFNFLIFGKFGGLYSILGLLTGALIVELIARSGYLLAGKRAMGEADTYVAGALGAVFGIDDIIFVFLYGLIFSMVFILPIFLYNQYKNDNKKVCILSILFVLSILVFETLCQNLCIFIFLLLIGLALVYFILKGLRENPDTCSYLPFVPALAAGALFYLFFIVQLQV